MGRMSEIVEMVLDGVFCEECGSIVDGSASGYPRQCEDCEAAKERDLKKRENFYKRQF